MRLRHRLFLWMLAVSLLLLNAAAGLLITSSFKFAMETEKSRALTEAAIIASSVYQKAKDLELQPLRDEVARQASFFEAQGVKLTMLQDGRTLEGGEPEYPELLPDSSARLWQVRDKSLKVAQRLDDKLTLIYERDVSGLYDNRDRLLQLTLVLCVSGSVLILLCAMLIARLLMRPLKKLQTATMKIAAGEYGVSLPTRGQDETAELARHFEVMEKAVREREAELVEQAERKQLFIDSLAHEMRTPLTAVMGYARYLQSVDAGEEERHKALDYIAREAGRLKNLDETLMALTRITHDGAEKEPVEIQGLLEEAAHRAQPMYEAKAVALKIEAEEGAWQGDEALLLLAAANLLHNALTASSPGMTVTLRGTPEELSVADTGMGMTREQLERACEPFYKADKARTRKAGGAGLGLTLVKRAAAAHGAELTLDSTPGEGTTAKISFHHFVTTA
jgi:signal transduction histidine kinase